MIIYTKTQYVKLNHLDKILGMEDKSTVEETRTLFALFGLRNYFKGAQGNSLR